MTDWTKEELEKVLLEIKKKAITDADFRRQALLDASSVVKDISGKELPDGMKLKFIENDGAHMTIVLPDMATGEISEDELDQVAGGTYITYFCLTGNNPC